MNFDTENIIAILGIAVTVVIAVVTAVYTLVTNTTHKMKLLKRLALKTQVQCQNG